MRGRGMDLPPVNWVPKVSVCVPTYNHAHFLHDAIASILKQTYTDFELVVVDNCSTDDTETVVAGYAATDHRIRYVRNQLNVGAQNNLNRCLEEARGDYIKIVCADDLLRPDCLAKMVEMLDTHPSVTLAGSARLLTNDVLQPIMLLSFSWEPVLMSGADAAKLCLTHGNLIGEPTAVLFRKKDAQRGFNTAYQQLIDLDLWFHLLMKGDFAFTPEPLCVFRRHAGQETRGNTKTLKFIDDGRKIARDYLTGRIQPERKYKLKWDIQCAMDIWIQMASGIPIGIAHRRIQDIVPLPVLYLWLPYKIFVQLVRNLRGRFRAKYVTQCV
jgi:glycosyltransferase involved in cell wall biosynthesis